MLKLRLQMSGIFFVTQCACTVYIASFGRKRLSPPLYVRVFYTGIFFKFTKNANVDYYGAKRSGIELAWLPDSVTFSFISLQKKCMPFTIRVSGFQQQQKATLLRTTLVLGSVKFHLAPDAAHNAASRDCILSSSARRRRDNNDSKTT